MTLIRRLQLPILPLLLTVGCSQVVLEIEADEPIAGVYDGYVDSRFAFGLIARSGTTAFYLPETGEIYAGRLSSDYGDVFGPMTRFRQVQGSEHSSHAVADEYGNLDAFVLDGDVLEGYFESPHSLRDIELYFDAATSFHSDLPQGTYENLDAVSGFYTHISISPSGNLLGDDDAGCTFEGRIRDGGSINVHPLDLSVDCPGTLRWSGGGSASVYRVAGSETLLITASNDQRAYAAELTLNY